MIKRFESCEKYFVWLCWYSADAYAWASVSWLLGQKAFAEKNVFIITIIIYYDETLARTFHFNHIFRAALINSNKIKRCYASMAVCRAIELYTIAGVFATLFVLYPRAHSVRSPPPPLFVRTKKIRSFSIFFLFHINFWQRLSFSSVYVCARGTKSFKFLFLYIYVCIYVYSVLKNCPIFKLCHSNMKLFRFYVSSILLLWQKFFSHFAQRRRHDGMFGEKLGKTFLFCHSHSRIRYLFKTITNSFALLEI